MTWGLEDMVTARFSGAGIPKDHISFARSTYVFEHSCAPSGLLDDFSTYCGPTMNAFAAAEAGGRARALRQELDDLFQAQNRSDEPDRTQIPATFLKVTISV